jgi:hypothetical protein
MGSSGPPSSATSAGTTIYELTGSHYPVRLGTGNNFTDDGVAWDYDGDGKLEIVCGFNPLEVFDVTTGQKVGALNGGLLHEQLQRVVDLDGNGKLDLLLSDNMTGGQMAVGLHGNSIWKSNATVFRSAWGNVDSDKLAEQIEEGLNQIIGTDMQGQQTILNNWGSNSSLNSGGMAGFKQLHCADINGDGLDEVIDAQAGYLDPKTQKYIAFNRPARPHVNSYSAGMIQAAVVAGDFDGDGTRELAVTDSAGSTAYGMALGTALLIYRADGSLEYNEEFGAQVHGLTAVKDGTRDRLAVLLDNRLLLAP